MATKSANLYVRIEPDVKEQAEGILAALGIPASNAINMFYKQIILQGGLPFEFFLTILYLFVRTKAIQNQHFTNCSYSG